MSVMDHLLIAHSKDALVRPVPLQIRVAQPFVRVLELVCHRCLKAVLFRQVLLQLLLGDQRVSKELEFVIFCLE